jgi:voltage-gated potassium channel Kch
MGATFWIKRYLLAAVPLFAILAAVEWFKGSTTREDYLSAAAWALAAATIFTYSAWRRFRNAQACGACDSLPATGKGKKAL